MGIDWQQVASVLTERGADQPCHRCGKREFTVVEGYSQLPIQDEPAGLHLSGKTIPTVLVICKNCGAVTWHALGALGLRPSEQEATINE